jgi:hypothetical protein
MSKTNQQILDDGSSPNDFVVAIAQLRDTDDNGFGSMLAQIFVPAWKVRTGLSSSATHIETLPGTILQVADAAGTSALLIVPGTAGAGEVRVTYDSAGIPTLVFGDGANTGYQVLKFEAPAGIAAKLATGFR